MTIKQIPASSHSYGGSRPLSAVKYIVIHYTGGTKDTAENEGVFFQKSNKRSAGAHFFVDQSGSVVQSVALSKTAWSVGGFFTQANGAGKYYKKCTNSNSVSIELCAIANKAPSAAQIQATKDLVGCIKKQCPNAKTVIRHWDVNGKSCPATMTGTNNRLWNSLKAALDGAEVAKAQQTAQTAAKPQQTVEKLKVDGILGTQTIKAWQRVLGVTADGKIGTQTVKAIQRWAGCKVDGILGTQTKKAVQRKLGVTADGIWGKKTYAALQKYLNQH